MASEVIEVRQYNAETDKAFLFSTWLRNYKHSSYFAKRIKPALFFAGHHKIIEHILSKPSTAALVACNPEDHEQIFGFMVCDKDEPVVHFVFVKDAFRSKGVARKLLQTSQIDVNKLMFTHWTYPVDELIRKYPDITYDPYKI